MILKGEFCNLVKNFDYSIMNESWDFEILLINHFGLKPKILHNKIQVTIISE